MAQPHILFVSRALGVPIVSMPPATGWRVTDGTLYAAEDHYALAGFKQEHWAVMLMLDVWNVLRLPKLYPVRTLRRSNLEQKNPWLAPLLQTIDRLESVADLISAFPGLRSDLESLFDSVQISTDSIVDQWHLSLLLLSVGANPESLKLDAAVFEELQKLKLYGPAPVTAFSVRAENRFERLLALTVSGFKALLKMREKGLSDSTGLETLAASEITEVDFGSDSAAAEDVAADEAGETDEATEASPTIESLLAMPIPVDGQLVREMIQEGKQTEPLTSAAETNDFETQNLETQHARNQLARSQYLERVHALRQDIDALLGELRKYLLPDTSPVLKLGRQLQPDGEVLSDEHLALIFASAKAGVARPDAYRPRIRLHKPQKNLQNTDYVLIIDRSSSMRNLAQHSADSALVMTEALAAFMREEPELDTRTALIVFDSTATVIKPLSRGATDAVRLSLYEKARVVAGQTNDAAAFRAAANEFIVASDGKRRRRVVVVISDGESSDPASAATALRSLKQLNAEIWGVGVGDSLMSARFAPLSKTVQSASELPRALSEIITQSIAHSDKHYIATERFDR